jgi:hypothetical protein
MLKAAYIILLLLFVQPVVIAQTSDDSDSNKEEKSFSVEESLFRASVERAEARQRKLNAAAEELNSLAQDLLKSLQGRKRFDEEAQKKLSKIEKLAKKVRSDQGGGGDDDEIAETPKDVYAALERLQQAAEAIQTETSKLTRHGISATLIEKTNEAIALTKFIKKTTK